METKKTKATAKPGEIKPANPEVQQKMIVLSNNSRLTQDTARMLTNKLSLSELNEFGVWLRHAIREQTIKTTNQTRNFKRF